MYGTVLFMWLASSLPKPESAPRNSSSAFLSRPHSELLAAEQALLISPQVATHWPNLEESSNGIVLIHVGHVTRYWNLCSDPKSLNTPQHPLIKKISDLKHLPQQWILAPTAPWAIALARLHNTSDSASRSIQVWDATLWQHQLQQLPISAGAMLVDDCFPLSSLEAQAWEHFLSSFEIDFGFQNLGELFQKAAQLDFYQDCVERWGSVVGKLLKRLRGRDDWKLKWHQPAMNLHASSWIEGSEGPLALLQQLLEEWEWRLAARKRFLGSLTLTLHRDHGSPLVLRQSLPRPTREPRTLWPILQEKWLEECQRTQCHSTEFESSIVRLELESSDLVPEHDRQLNLFNPKREDTAEQWATLLGRIAAKQSRAHPIRVGSFQSFPSHIPEQQVEWVDWQSPEASIIFPDPPTRPMHLLEKPEPFSIPTTSLSCEQDFLEWTLDASVHPSLERICDPWAGTDRSYVRWNDLWIFWDHNSSSLFLHGYFEHHTHPQLELPTHLSA